MSKVLHESCILEITHTHDAFTTACSHLHNMIIFKLLYYFIRRIIRFVIKTNRIILLYSSVL